MQATKIAGATHTFSKPQGWDDARDGHCFDLPVRALLDGRQMTFASAWKPTPEELAQLNAGGHVVLTVFGSQPPVMLTVEDAEPALLAAIPLDRGDST